MVLGNSAGGTAHIEEPPGHFLAAADLPECPIGLGIPVQRQRLLLRTRNHFIHDMPRKGGAFRRTSFLLRQEVPFCNTEDLLNGPAHRRWLAPTSTADRISGQRRLGFR
jgi:hypothetical protein